MATEPYLSLQRFNADGVITDWSVSFAGNHPDFASGTTPYIRPEDIKAFEVIPATSVSFEVQIPREVQVIGPTTIRITPPVPAGRQLVVQRLTESRYNLVDFKALQTVSEFDLDHANRQLLFLTQEATDRSRLATEAAASVTEAAVEATITAAGAVARAEQAELTAAGAVQQVGLAINTANNAVSVAQGAVASAQQANTTANGAVDIAVGAVATADTARDIAEGIAGTAQNALTVANGISGTATQALTSAQMASQLSMSAEAMAREALEIGQASGVSTFNGRQGNVSPMAGDYSASMISTPSGNLDVVLTSIGDGFDAINARLDGVDTALDGVPQQISSLTSSKADKTEVAAEAAARQTAINSLAATVQTNRDDAWSWYSASVHRSGSTLTGGLRWENVSAAEASAISAVVSGGGFESWRERPTAIQVDVPNSTTAAHCLLRATHWGMSHRFGLDIHAGGQTHAVFHVGSRNNAFTFYESGDLVAQGNIVAYSDVSLKTNVTTIEDALTKVNAMRGVNYTRISNGRYEMGVIAQEVQEVCPEVVAESYDGTLGVAYPNLVGVLIQAVNELTARVKALEEGGD